MELQDYLYPTRFLFTEHPPAAVPRYVVQDPNTRAVTKMSMNVYVFLIVVN